MNPFLIVIGLSTLVLVSIATLAITRETEPPRIVMAKVPHMDELRADVDDACSSARSAAVAVQSLEETSDPYRKVHYG